MKVIYLEKEINKIAHINSVDHFLVLYYWRMYEATRLCGKQYTVLKTCGFQEQDLN